MRAAWSPDARKNMKTAQNYIMVVNRANVLGDSLEKLVKIKAQNGVDPLKLPLKTEFENVKYTELAKEGTKICKRWWSLLKTVYKNS